MRTLMLKSIVLASLVCWSPFALACFSIGSGQSCPRDCGKKQDSCCGNMGGISYCDSSAGRYVCENGDYSACYCTRHAVMDFQSLQGCCLWQGGVRDMDEKGRIICHDGSDAEICNLVQEAQKQSNF
ncbi:MAG: hypothetical protein JJT82_04210 [Legionellaceae bacterium]|nr:hypothetical protein [Legionellaceae bacterium]